MPTAEQLAADLLARHRYGRVATSMRAQRARPSGRRATVRDRASDGRRPGTPLRVHTVNEYDYL
ncbi:hypothetical protein ACI2L1_05155 [Streptomyces sp. NPDC019531]|uniref:hypothetical protein n=1 Tax=Streptomyces sp. NPDC019531 TaxID=3365062 RepID=UPI00384FB7F9